jgi:hypothetical protein
VCVGSQWLVSIGRIGRSFEFQIRFSYCAPRSCNDGHPIQYNKRQQQQQLSPNLQLYITYAYSSSQLRSEEHFPGVGIITSGPPPIFFPWKFHVKVTRKSIRHYTTRLGYYYSQLFLQLFCFLFLNCDSYQMKREECSAPVLSSLT